MIVRKLLPLTILLALLAGCSNSDDNSSDTTTSTTTSTSLPISPLPSSAIAKAQDAAAQADLRNALTATKTIYADEQSYESITEAKLKSVEPALEYVKDQPSTKSGVVAYSVPSSSVVVVAVRSNTGTCWVARDDVEIGTEYAQGGECDGSTDGLEFSEERPRSD